VYSKFFEIPLPSLCFKEKGGICTDAQHIQTTKAKMTFRRMTQRKRHSPKWRSEEQHSALMLSTFNYQSKMTFRRTTQRKQHSPNDAQKNNTKKNDTRQLLQLSTQIANPRQLRPTFGKRKSHQSDTTFKNDDA
jgi:hypothetical protein